MKEKFYITTTIPYVNARPHAGHALEYVQADVLARYNRLTGKEVFFLSGTDENSLKNYQAAREQGVSTQELVDKNAEVFKDLAKALNISLDDFIRTTEPKHFVGAKKLWMSTEKDIYKKEYKGIYCVGCERFFREEELIDGLCPDHKTRPEIIEEENYFFRLSGYQKELEELIESDRLQIAPASRKNEALAFIRAGLEDFSISRSAERGEGWGVPVPKDESQRMYVWFDALGNYLTALGYGSDNMEKFEKYWPADLHCLGKGVLRFHAIYWPAILLSAGLVLPKKLFVHGYLTSGGQKMSKSLGNVINPFDLIEKYGTDAVRYYLLREASSFEDSDITEEKFREAYNAGLANGLGNLVSRIMKMAEQFDGFGEEIFSLEEVEKSAEKFEFNKAMDYIWSLISRADLYIQEEQPFKVIKTDKEKARAILQVLVSSLNRIASLLEPFMPETSEKIKKAIRANKIPEPLFLRKE